MEGWRKNWIKNGTYLTFHNAARLAAIILVFGKTPAFTIVLSPPSIHPCRAAAPAIHHRGACKTPLHPSSLSQQQIKKKYVKCDYTGNMFIGTDTPGHTLFLECCITNGYTGRWGFTPTHVQCRQIWASRVYASHLCAKQKTRPPPTSVSLKKGAKKRKNLIHREGKCSFLCRVQTSEAEFRSQSALIHWLRWPVRVCMCVCVSQKEFPGWRTTRTRTRRHL